MSPLKLLRFLLPCLFCLTGVYGDGITYKIQDRSKDKPGDKFASKVILHEAYGILRGATEFARGTFSLGGRGDMSESKYDSVALIVQSFEEHRMPSHAHAVAKTTRNVIILNSDYLQRYRGDMKEEFSGIVYHESARMWQNNGNGQAPEGLLTGIADYVRMKAGHSSKDWPRKGSGSRWDQGYAVTAYFLEYCSSLRPGGNFIRDLNAMMKHSYTHEYFQRLLGRSIHELWSNYLNYYRPDVGEVKPTLRRSSSPQTTQLATREGTVSSVIVLPRLPKETYELMIWYQQRSEAASRGDEGETMWGRLAKKIRGMIVTTVAVGASYQDKEDGHGYA